MSKHAVAWPSGLESGGPAAAYRCWCSTHTKHHEESKVGRARRCRRISKIWADWARQARPRASRTINAARQAPQRNNQPTSRSGRAERAKRGNSKLENLKLPPFFLVYAGWIAARRGHPQGQPGLDSFQVMPALSSRMTSPISLTLMTPWRRSSPSGVPAGSGEPPDLVRVPTKEV